MLKRPQKDDSQGQTADLIMRSMGLPQFDLPARGINPELYFVPFDLHRVSMQEIRKRHAAIVNYMTWLSTEKTKAKVALAEMWAQMKRREVFLCACHPSLKEKWKLENMFRGDKQWADLESAAASLEAKVDVVNTEIANLEARANLLSREQSAREAEMRNLPR